MVANLDSPTFRDVVKRLEEFKNDEYAAHHQSFFKTGRGCYGEGDVFLGLTVPKQREIASGFRNLPLEEIEKLLMSPFHECRFTALVILINFFNKGNDEDKSDAVNLYLRSTQFINNWDLVDVSAHKILGPWLENRDRNVLYTLADSDSLWEQRISILTTMHFVRRGDFDDCLAISERLLYHRHDLIHKAVGWLLREIGKKDRAVLDDFLQKYYKTMPRTMLRYAIEKHSATERREYLGKGKILSDKS